MKINKIKCDICGDLVDYNNIPVNREWPDIEDAQRFKINKITLNGIRETFVAPFKPVFINIEYDLCAKCLERFNVLIYKIKNGCDNK